MEIRVDGVWGKKVAFWWIFYRFPEGGECLHLTSYLYYAPYEKLLFLCLLGLSENGIPLLFCVWYSYQVTITGLMEQEADLPKFLRYVLKNPTNV